MDTLKSGSFGALVGVTFTVAATFQVAMALLGVLIAFVSPSAMKLNGAPATNTGQALATVAIMLVVILLFNALISCVGSALWLVARKLVFRRREQPTA